MLAASAGTRYAVAMIHRISFLVPMALFCAAAPTHAASNAALEQEYQQVRKIALRDPKVRAAYEDADRRLQAKILQISPQ